MAMTYTKKYAEKVDERFFPKTKSHHGTNNDYKFTGGKTLAVTSVDVGSMADYNRANGYGTPAQIENDIQEMTMSRDRSFSILLDKMDEAETMIKAGEVLARQLNEVVNPEMEAYRFGKMGRVAITNTLITQATGKAYKAFLEANEKLDDANVPETGRVAYVTPAFYNKIKQDSSFVQASDIAQSMLIKGQIGELDGVKIFKVSKDWLEITKTGGESANPKLDCLIVHKSATIAPVQLAEYKVVTDSERYSGTLFLGRVYYDCFVLDNKTDALAGVSA